MSAAAPLPESATWQDNAACKGHNPDLWHPTSGDVASAARAKAICARCPVRQECLDLAISNSEQHGIWAGLRARELTRASHAQSVGLVHKVECRNPACETLFIRGDGRRFYCSDRCAKANHVRQRVDWARMNRIKA